MATVTITVATTSTSFPSTAGTTGILIAISGLVSLVVTAAPYVAVFEDVAPGTYTANAQALDAGRAPLGDAITSAPFTVAGPGVMIDMPSGISVSVQ